MLYYTIAYDWMLFGHDLQDRLSKGEEIFFFCFYFLKYICDEDFSVKPDLSSKSDSKSSSSSSIEVIDDPIFDMEPVTEDPSISANDSDSNRNDKASKDDRNTQNNSPFEIISTNSPPGTEESSNKYVHFLIMSNTVYFSSINLSAGFIERRHYCRLLQTKKKLLTNHLYHMIRLFPSRYLDVDNEPNPPRLPTRGRWLPKPEVWNKSLRLLWILHSALFRL